MTSLCHSWESSYRQINLITRTKYDIELQFMIMMEPLRYMLDWRYSYALVVYNVITLQQ